MTDRIIRRVSACIYLTIAIAIVVLGGRVLTAAHYHEAYVSGWSLFAIVCGLALLGVRKKLSFLPVGSASTWVQVHIYVGVLSGVLYLIHTSGRIPSGIPDILVAAAYVATCVSGLIGLVLSRSIPRLLAGRGTEILFERIPEHIRKLRLEIESLVTTEDDVPQPILGDLYVEELQQYFRGPRNAMAHMLQLSGPREKLLHQAEERRRFLSSDESETLDQIIKIIVIKDSLDYHFAHQGALKLWLFIHIPATTMLLIFSLLHIFLVHAFVG